MSLQLLIERGTWLSTGGRRAVRRIVVAAAACAAWVGLIATAAPGAEPVRNPVGAAVSVMKAKRACFKDSVEVTGILVPREEVLVRPDREGMQVSRILADAGETVKAGQPLVRLTALDGSGATVDVNAPVAGVVAKRFAVVGATASARAEPLFTLIAQGDLELAAEVPGKRFSQVSTGQQATVKVVGMTDLKGRLRFTAPSIDPTTQLGQIRISLDNNPQLRAGSFARAIIDITERCGVGIPFSAVLYGAGGAIVQVVRDARIETHRVALGLRSEGTVEAREGINEGDLVVARAGSFVREGDRVRPVLVGEDAKSR
jgi:HlyD family secretion protein